MNVLSIKSPDDLKFAYETLCKKEAAVTECLELSVSDRHNLEAKLSQLARLLPTLQLVEGDAQKLENTISFTHQLANNVSAKVRQLDLAKSRVVETQKRVGDLLDLEGCADGVARALSQEDYETAAAHIHRFLAMDETVLRHSTQSSTKAETLESWFDRLKKAHCELILVINDKFDEAVKKKDLASIDRFFKLFPLLNEQEAGLKKFTTYLCSKIQENTSENLTQALSTKSSDKRSHVIWADTVTLLFEGIARTVEIRQPIIETYYGPGHLYVVMDMLQKECDRQVGRIVTEMKKNRKLNNIVSTVKDALRLDSPTSKSPLPDPRELDTLLGELTLMNTRADLYLRFVRRRVNADFVTAIESREERGKKENEFEAKLSQSQLVCEMAIIIGDYTVLEEFYLNQSFKKAITMDSFEGECRTSSLVDDVFYIIKKSVRRAIASSSVDGVCAMLNNAVTLIESQLGSHLHHALKKGFPAQGYLDLYQAYSVLQSSFQTGKTNFSSSDSDVLRQAFIIALNNGDTSILHVKSLHSTLSEDIDSTFPQISHTAGAKLESCLTDLRNCTARLTNIVEFGLSQLRAAAIKPRVKPWVDSFSEISHNITEEKFSCNEANDLFSQNLVHVDAILGSFLPILTTENYKALVSMLVSEIALQLEKAVMKASFNRLGGLQFDREIRAVIGYLSQVSEWSIREQMARLTQIATLLNLEKLSEVSEYSSTITWRLTPSEMKQVLRLRVDFKEEEVEKLKL